MKNEDYDIKIFSPVKKIDETEAQVVADEMKKQIISGNTQKAKDLGKRIGETFPDAAAKEELWNMAGCCGVELDRSIKDQAIILSVFTAEYCLNTYMPFKILSTTAVSTFYDTLISDAPDLYNNLLSSAAFSFYYIDARNDNVDSESIGKTFAMLCGNKESEDLICYGKSVFETSLETYKAELNKVDFAK